MTAAVDWARIESFVGYGRIDAPVVFIGMEEGLYEVSALAADLLFRSRFTSVMDVELAHRGIVGGPALFTDKPRRQNTWRVMADVMLHFEGRAFANAADRARARTAYRARCLGRANGNSLLAELLPYPHPKRSSWLYANRFPSKADYVAEVAPKRHRLLISAIEAYSRRAIVCYGKTDWDGFKKLFPRAQWIEKGRFLCADWRGTPITLTDHFSRYFNTDDQLNRLAEVALRAG